MLVAFLVLGPGKTMDMAKSAGKILGEVRRSMADISKVMDIDPQTVDFEGRNQTGVPRQKDPQTVDSEGRNQASVPRQKDPPDEVS